MVTHNGLMCKFKFQASCIKHKKQHQVKVLLNQIKLITPQLSTLMGHYSLLRILPQVSKAKTVTKFFPHFLLDVSLSSHCTVSFHEACLWALPFSWYRCLSWSLLWTRISSLVFDRVGLLKNHFPFYLPLLFCTILFRHFFYFKFQRLFWSPHNPHSSGRPGDESSSLVISS